MVRMSWLCWLLLVVTILAWLPQITILSPGISYGDEGLVAQSALRIYKEQLPFSDYFTAIVPGTYYFFALIFSLLGPTFLALRICVIVVAALLGIFSWELLKKASCATQRFWFENNELQACMTLP